MQEMLHLNLQTARAEAVAKAVEAGRLDPKNKKDIAMMRMTIPKVNQLQSL